MDDYTTYIVLITTMMSEEKIHQPTTSLHPRFCQKISGVNKNEGTKIPR